MDVRKSALSLLPGEGGSDLERINRFAKTELREEEVYTFSILLCDNEVDRDFERFSIPALHELGELFTGKTGISDHDWSASRQVARIYRTQVVSDESRVTSAGEPYTYLRAWAYILRSGENEALIRDIEGGIKRETSIGCAVSRRSCSVCGEDQLSGRCGHVPGTEAEDGSVCHHVLEGAVDAYEWSFVAVPAQPKAGVMKKFRGGAGEHAVGDDGGGGEELRKKAELAETLLHALRLETLRLALTCDRALGTALESSIAGMGPEALLSLRESLQKRADTLFPPLPQIRGGAAEPAPGCDDPDPFRI